MEEELERLTLEDDDYEEEEEAPPVVLGFLREAEHPWVVQRQHFPSKAGGAPAWLDPENLPPVENATCGFCEEPLQFLLQVYAPPAEEKEYTFHRTLFVFMCTKMECLRRNQTKQKEHGSHQRSIKVFRAQLPRKNQFYSPEGPKPSTLPLTQGVNLCNWCKTWKGSKVCSACKKTRYCSSQHQRQHWEAGHRDACQNGEAGTISWSPHWKELELDTESEPADDEAESQPLQLVSTQPDRLSAELENFEEASEEQQCLAAFQARVQRAPSQVLRYCYEDGAKPLWTSLERQAVSDDVTNCHLCGGPRVYEFQILPQLLYYFRVDNGVNSLDWGTIVIYSCADSCPVTGYAEEFAWVQ